MIPPGAPPRGPACGPACGIVGKLPAHGDFVRRGGPAAVLAQLDRWLDAGLGDAVGAGMAPEAAIAALDGWRFAFAVPGGTAIATAIASEDGVGRHFPLIGVTTGADGASFAAAERWCAVTAEALAAVRDAGQGADAASAAIEPLGAPPPDAGGPVAGWWRAGDAAPAGTAQLPAGDAFRALLRREGA